ncbi:MAG TPA: SprT-like domain-containing protein, partial [Pyrinomonadaceae bacterium]|nr:SprT-like domain-containing protein [Pyrinomonadaceae bacterium]
MAPDSKVFQEIADAMLPLFDNMRPVRVLVEDHAIFHQERALAGVYEWSNIRINPSYALTCSFEEMQGIICHELIHAWLHRKGLDGLGEFLDDHHNEWFVRKALEINEKIDSLNLRVDYLLVTPAALDIYHRVAG